MSTIAVIDPQALVREQVRKVSTIATLPEVTSRIVTTVEDPRSTASQLHKLVSHDPALVSRILKVVNSAFYGLPGQIGSVERAIVLLGLNAIKNIAVAASLGQLFRVVTLCEGYSAKDLWTHCIAVGVTARALAREMKAAVVEEAFLAGMIHDLGLLVSLQVAPEKLREVCERAQSTGGDFCEIERELCGVDHQQLGAGLTEMWKFPRSCQLVAGFHHRPTALSDEHRLLVTLVYIADTLVCRHGKGFSLTAIHQDIDAAALDHIQLDRGVVERVETNLDIILSDAATLMG